LARWLSLLGLVLALVVISTTFFHSLLHLRDSSSMNSADGVWVGLAFWANQGVLYPPIYDGQHFAGTRYMAIPILAHAGMARVTGDYVAAGKINSLIGITALLTILFFSLLCLGCSPAFSLTLCSCLLLTVPGRLAAFSARNDSLPVFMQLLALLLVARPHARVGLVGAGVLSSLAAMSKVSAVWGGLAIAAWLLLRRDARGLLWFLSAAVIMAAGALGLFWFLSGGRIAENLLSFSFLGYDHRPSAVLRRLAIGGLEATTAVTASLGAIGLLAPLALTRIVLALGSRRVNPFDLAFLLCALATCVQFGSTGVTENHLIDISCLILLVVGSLWDPHALTNASATDEPTRAKVRRTQVRVATELWLRPALTITAIWGILTVLVAERFDKVLRGDLRTARGDAGEVRLEPSRWPDAFRGGSPIISEDAALPVVLGQRPVVLDAFLLRRYEALYPEWYREFVERVRRGDYPLLVLLQDLERPIYPGWYKETNFGVGLTEAFRSRYRFREKLGKFFIYELASTHAGRPRSSPPTVPPPAGVPFAPAFLPPSSTFVSFDRSPCCGCDDRGL
jgi:hypothetical protein